MILRGLFGKLFGNKKKDKEQAVSEYFETLTAYQPAFRTFEGSLYEMDLTRAAIHSFATHCSKLKPMIKGSARQDLAKVFPSKANPWQVTSQYLYRLATILSCNNNAFIVPVENEITERIDGFFTVLPNHVQLKELENELYIVYEFTGGKKAAIEFEKVGIMIQHQYSDDFFGASNDPMQPTMQLLDAQNQGIIEGIKQAATIRFLAKLGQTLKNTDIEKERDRFTRFNLEGNYSGVMMVDQKYAEVKQLESKPFVVDADQVNQIKESVFNYFGTNEKILQNKYTPEEWSAYYEGKIEPFALQASLVHTHMTFSSREKSQGNEIFFETNRIQFLSPDQKRQIVTELFDRGFITHNQGLDILNLPNIPNGDQRYIRLEYMNAQGIKNNGGEQNEQNE